MKIVLADIVIFWISVVAAPLAATIIALNG